MDARKRPPVLSRRVRAAANALQFVVYSSLFGTMYAAGYWLSHGRSFIIMHKGYPHD